MRIPSLGFPDTARPCPHGRAGMPGAGPERLRNHPCNGPSPRPRNALQIRPPHGIPLDRTYAGTGAEWPSAHALPSTIGMNSPIDRAGEGKARRALPLRQPLAGGTAVLLTHGSSADVRGVIPCKAAVDALRLAFSTRRPWPEPILAT
jgi:hypothetical protein